MDWKKKKRIIWGCFAVASLITIGGALIHPLVNLAGIIGLVCICGFCMMDE
jgi:hypothetical protein